MYRKSIVKVPIKEPIKPTKKLFKTLGLTAVDF